MTASNDNNPAHFLSVCAGIEAASLAWHNLGWRPCLLSEIEKFTRRVLAHHYPQTRLWGDFTALRVRHLRRMGLPLPAILVGGTPCQAFSVAGLRKSLADARGNLTLSFVRLAHALANAGSLRNAVWENVPGVLNTKDNAFGCFLGAIVGADDALPCPAGGSWPNAGMVAGPRARAAWRVLDAQYFGLAQRRRRVFVVVDFGNGADPAAVLFEPVGVLGNSPPRREAQKDVAGTVAGGARKGGGYSTDDVPLTAQGYSETGPGGWTEGLAGLRANPGGMPENVAVLRGISDYDPGSPALRAKGGDCGGGSEALVFAPDLARCDATREGNSQDYETTTMVSVAGTLTATYGEQSGQDMLAAGMLHPQCVTGDVTHTLRAEGFDASEDGTGRGNPIIAFSAKDYGSDAMIDIAPRLRAGGHSASHANAGVMTACAFNTRQDPIHENDCAQRLGAKDNGNGVLISSAVRRLTPRECERLQGFPDDYTLLPNYEADGPRYKALGNSMAVPCMRWIGERIALHMPAANDNLPIQKAA